jgi:hypothetical protein
LHSFFPLQLLRSLSQPLRPLQAFFPLQQSLGSGSLASSLDALGAGTARGADVDALGGAVSIGAVTLVPLGAEHAIRERPASIP